MRLVLLIIIIVLLIGALPTWPDSSGWGYYPAGGLGLVLIILLVLVLLNVRRRNPTDHEATASIVIRPSSVVRLPSFDQAELLGEADPLQLAGRALRDLVDERRSGAAP